MKKSILKSSIALAVAGVFGATVAVTAAEQATPVPVTQEVAATAAPVAHPATHQVVPTIQVTPAAKVEAAPATAKVEVTPAVKVVPTAAKAEVAPVAPVAQDTTPVPTATAAAGVEAFKIQLSIVSNPLIILETNLGYAQKLVVGKNKNIKNNIIIK